MRKFALCALALVGLVARPAGALDILLTNDDGFNFTGIQVLRAALCAAGHHVTLVGPATNQSGRGGSLNVGAFNPGSVMQLTRQSTDACGVVYSLASPTGPGSYGGTPVDSVSTGLDVVLANDPPDLVLSGLNIGQNMGKGSPSASGTVGAALAAALRGIPAIAGSVGVNFAEAPGFPSTFGAFGPAADFIVRLVAALEAAPGDALLPQGVRLLNVNFPVPYANTRGWTLTALGDFSDIALPIFDLHDGFPPLFPPTPPSPSCAGLADGQFCSVLVAFANVAGPDPQKNADVDAYRANLISITPMDGDMTASGAGSALNGILHGLTP